MIALYQVRTSTALEAFHKYTEESKTKTKTYKLFLCVQKERGDTFLTSTTIDKMGLWDRIQKIFGYGNASLKAVSEFLKSDTYQNIFSVSDNRDEMIHGEEAFNEKLNKRTKYAKYKTFTDVKLLQTQFQSIKEKITDYTTEGLFRLSGSAKTVKEIVSAIRKGQIVDNPKYSQHDYACALKQLIREMHPSLFDIFSNETILNTDVMNIHDLQFLINPLSDENKQLLKSLLFLLKQVKDAQIGIGNPMTSEALSTCFAPNLRTSDISTVVKFNTIIQAMIENYQSLNFETIIL